ncbi:hypothetical protein [Stutzerimonas nitrititolerans]|uniref:hypothetical protein n=1 Tax=Stutzerimonas nitrititolerans TaxID=2482751 RepID=UPI00289E5F69|nr:hypothetical protein [Stutzerimonas nitrititolerans]
MSTYEVHAVGMVHDVTAHTYTIGSEGLKFIGSDGVTVAIFTTFDWMKLVPVTA